MSTKKQSALSPKKSAAAKAPMRVRAASGKVPAKRTKAPSAAPAKARALSREAREAAARQLKEAKRLERQQEQERAAAQARAERDAKARERVAARLEREAERERKKQEAREKRAAERELRRAARAGRPRAPRPGLPKIKKGRMLQEVDMRKDWSARPLTGRDLDALGRRFRLNSSEFSSALGLQNRFQFVSLIRTAAVVPFDVEMLARLYEMSPSPAPWVSYSADQAFQTLYGPALEEFSGDEEDLAYARTLFYARFTASLDRSSSTAYRWVEDEGKARLVIALFLRKLMSMDKPLETLENLTRLVHKVREGDFDLRAPYPQQGARLTRRGRAAKLNRTANKQHGSGLPIDLKPLVL